jgi:hypothetical protein
VRSSDTKQLIVQPLLLPQPTVVVHRRTMLVHAPTVQLSPPQEPDVEEAVGGAITEDKLPLRNMTMLCNECSIFMYLCVPACYLTLSILLFVLCSVGLYVLLSLVVLCTIGPYVPRYLSFVILDLMDLFICHK